MKIPAENVTASQLMTMTNYVEYLKKAMGKDTISKGTVNHHIDQENDLVDWTEVDGKRFIVMTDKSKRYRPGTNYKGRRKVIKQSL